jgi:hypothetical protein
MNERFLRVVEFLETSVFDISKEWFKQEIAKKQGLLVPVRHLFKWDRLTGVLERSDLGCRGQIFRSLNGIEQSSSSSPLTG